MIGGQIYVASAREYFLGINLRFLVHQLEHITENAHRFGWAKNEIAARIKRVMKDRQTTSLQLHPEINQNIPAADQIEPRKRRIGGDVLFCKRADVAHHPVDLIGAVELFEKAFQARRRNI